MAVMKKIAMGLALLQARLRGQRLPLIVNWAITGRCNLRCSHCYGSYGTVQDSELSTESVFRVIDELKAAGTRRVTLEGGEPLLRQNIGQVVDRLAEVGLECSLCTNGVLFRQKVDLLRDKVDLVVFSLDGDEEAHDKIRGSGNFRTVLDAIELARRNGMRTLVFSTLVDGNLDDVEKLLYLARRIDTAITFNVAVAQLGSQGDRRSIPKERDAPYKEAIAKVLQHKSQGFPVFYASPSFQQVLDWPSLAQEKLFVSDLARVPDRARRHLIRCYAGRYHAYIECTGEVYPCYQTVGTLTARNATEYGFDAAFEHLTTVDYCQHCYNVTLSELNLQCHLDPSTIARVVANYTRRRPKTGGIEHR